MKKILQIGMSSSLGGIEVFLKNLYDNIDHKEFQFDFIDTTEKGICYKEEFEKGNSKIYKITSRSKNFMKNKKELEKVIKEGNYDVIHFHLNTLSYITPILLANKYNIKIIVHSHNEWKGKKIKVLLLDKINRKRIKKANIIRLACSDVAGKWIFENNQFLIINNAIDIEKFKFSEDIRKKIRLELNIPDNYTVLGNIGAFREQKNHEFLIDIYYEYLKLNPKSVLVLVGEGALMEKIKQKMKKLKISENVKFLGLRNDVNEVINAFDIFVFPSLYEGLGIVLVEAQCNGLLCFVSNTIPGNAKITNNIYYLPLEENSKYWADYIWKHGGIKPEHKNEMNKIKQAGYSVRDLAKKIEEIYNT